MVHWLWTCSAWLLKRETARESDVGHGWWFAVSQPETRGRAGMLAEVQQAVLALLTRKSWRKSRRRGNESSTICGAHGVCLESSFVALLRHFWPVC